jgi:hypothetical protein
MISAQTLRVCREENRCPLFRITLYGVVTSARHAAGNSASVSGGFGGSAGGAGWMTASENQ